MDSTHTQYLSPTFFMDSDHPAVIEYAKARTEGCANSRERAQSLFLVVRDEVRYNPYLVHEEPEHMKASRLLEVMEGFCVPKAILFAACARVVGIPSRLRFANVVNHLASPKLRALMKTDVFYYHGYAELWLGGRWIKTSPTFNRELCEKFGVDPLGFDGVNDAVMQPYDLKGNKHMEYVEDHGSFADVPFDTLIRIWRAEYDYLFKDENPGATDDAFRQD